MSIDHAEPTPPRAAGRRARGVSYSGGSLTVRRNRLIGAGDASLVRCVRIEDHGLLADFYFAVLEAVSTLVHMQDSTASGLLCVGKPVGARDRAFAEQALASANNHRELPDAQRIDEIVLEQGLEEVAAAVDLNLAAILCPELRDLLGNVALEQVRVVPTGTTPSSDSYSGGAPMSTACVDSVIPSFFGSGVPE
jgi:hypothetical protein